MPQIPQFTDDLGFISRLGDNPNTDDGLSSQALKEEFDKAPKLIQQFINNYVIPALNNYIMGNGYLPTTGGYMSGPISMQGNKITGLPDPETDTDAVTKRFMEAENPKVTPISKGGTNADNAEKARENLGAAAAVHTHKAQDIVEPIGMSGGGTGAQNGSDGLANLLAAGPMRLSEKQIVNSIEEIPADAPEGAFFVVLV